MKCATNQRLSETGTSMPADTIMKAVQVLWRTVMLAAFVAELGLGASAYGASKGGSRAPTAARECSKDTDCVVVPDGCCGCNEGGKQRALPARARASYEKRRKRTCRETMCTAMISQDASCAAGGAVCKEGTCKLGS